MTLTDLRRVAMIVRLIGQQEAPDGVRSRPLHIHLQADQDWKVTGSDITCCAHCVRHRRPRALVHGGTSNYIVQDTGAAPHV